jgi:pentatricopeptide repeat protein
MHVLLAFLEVVLGDNSRRNYEPGFKAWRNMIVALSRTTKADPTRWEMLRRPLYALFERNKRFCPDELLLKIGLSYCEATGDAKMARDLVVRSVDHHCSACERKPSFVSGYEKSDTRWKAEEDDTGFSLSVDGTNSEEASKTWQGLEIDEESGSGTVKHLVDDTATQANAVDLTILESAYNDKAGQLFWRSPASSIILEAAPDDLGTMHGEAGSIDTGSLENASDEAPRHSSAPFSYKVFQKAIKICIAADDATNGLSILDAFGRMENVYPKHIESQILGFALRGFASLPHGSAFVSGLFESMKGKRLEIEEDIYGAVLHSFAAGNQPAEVSKLFQEMKSKDGLQPALSCYNAIILSSIKAKAFGDVLDLYDEMKAAHVMPNDTTTQAVVIAAFRLGGREQVRQVLRETLDERVVVSRDNCQLALKILVPDIVKGTASVTDIQRRLRDLGSENEPLRRACLDLLRSFRQADTEQRRVPTTNAPLEVLVKRREQAWHATLNHILQMDEIRRGLKRQQLKAVEQTREISSPMA